MTFPQQCAAPPHRISPEFYNLAGLLLLTAAAVFVFALTIPGFASPASVANLLVIVAIPGVLAIGALPLFMAGAIDLSMSTLAVVAGLLTAALCGIGVNFWLASLLVLVAAGAIGILNGWLAATDRAAWLAPAFGAAGAAFGLASMLTNGFRKPPTLGFGIGLIFFNIVTLALIALGLWAWRHWRPANLGPGPEMRPIAATLGTAGVVIGLTAVFGAPSWGLYVDPGVNARDLFWDLGRMRVSILPAILLIPVAMTALVAWWTLRRREAAAFGGMVPYILASVAAALAGLLLLIRVLAPPLNLGGVSGWQMDVLAVLALGGCLRRPSATGLAATIVAVLLVRILVAGIAMLLFSFPAFPGDLVSAAILLLAVIWAAARSALTRRHGIVPGNPDMPAHERPISEQSR